MVYNLKLLMNIILAQKEVNTSLFPRPIPSFSMLHDENGTKHLGLCICGV